MTARLPTPGGDSGTWGDVLNTFLAVGHDASGKNIGVREVVTSARTYYVATTGSDSNDGLTSGTPFATLNHAIDIVQTTLYIDNCEVHIQLADGTYDMPNDPRSASESQACLMLGAWQGASASSYGVSILGHVGDPSAVLLTSTDASANYLITGNGPAVYFFESVSFDLPLGIGLIYTQNAFFLYMSRCRFGYVKDDPAALWANIDEGSLLYTLDCSGFGTAKTLFYAQFDSFIYIDNNGNSDSQFHFEVDPLCSLGVIEAQQDCSVFWNTNFTGTVTGPQALLTCGSSLQVLPGYTMPGQLVGSSIDGTSWFNGTQGGVASAVSDLPSAAVMGAGARSLVTDSNATLATGLGNVVANGGSNKVPVYSDGTNWIIG